MSSSSDAILAGRVVGPEGTLGSGGTVWGAGHGRLHTKGHAGQWKGLGHVFMHGYGMLCCYMGSTCILLVCCQFNAMLSLHSCDGFGFLEMVAKVYWYKAAGRHCRSFVLLLMGM